MVLGVIGAVCLTAALGCAVGLVSRMRRLRSAAARVDGVVIERESDSEAPWIRVEFRDAAGSARTLVSRGGSAGFPQVGEAAMVLYDPALPAQARIEIDLKNAAGVLAIFATLLAVAGAVLLLVARFV